MRTDLLVISLCLTAGCYLPDEPVVADRDCETRSLYYADTDGDGYGDEAHKWLACSPPVGAVDNAEDCDDQDANRALDCTEDTADTADTADTGDEA